jgi:murein DD-endopeptidase
MTPVTQRSKFIATALSQMGVPYVWAAKGSVGGFKAFDCSGLVTWAFHQSGGPDWRADKNCQHLWDECRPATQMRGGTLVLYGAPGRPTHVMIAVGELVVFGASGGGSQTTSIGIAQASGAKVQPKENYMYRPDCLGFRELPFTDE